MDDQRAERTAVLRPILKAASDPLKSPSAFTVNDGRSGRWALELKENGCSSMP